MFWSKVERIFGEIPKLIRLILEFNGFDTLLALKGIRWDDKKFFFEALEESVSTLEDLEDSDDLKAQFVEELSANHQRIKNFKLKLGHKNLIVNLCHELQKTNIEDFNGVVAQILETKRPHQELVVRKPEEHGYAHEKSLKRKQSSESEDQHFQVIQSPQHVQEVPVSEQKEQVQYVFENEEEEEGPSFIEQEFLEELETYEGEAEIVEYQEIQQDELETDDNCIYTSEQIIKQEADQYEQAERYEMSGCGYESSSSLNRSGPKNKKPKHMYTEEFLQTQMTHGRIGTPGRRRPKIQKHYPDTEEGLLDRWCDLVRQSCEVIVPTDLLSQHDLSHVEIVKIHDSIWEVKCPLCTKKLRLQLTHEGKYTNYKRSNFERHLRIVHYKQILQFKAYMSDDENMFEETTN